MGAGPVPPRSSHAFQFEVAWARWAVSGRVLSGWSYSLGWGGRGGRWGGSGGWGGMGGGGIVMKGGGMMV